MICKGKNLLSAWCWGALLGLFWSACSSGSLGSSKGAERVPAVQEPLRSVFRLSTARAVEIKDASRNWCLADFGQTEVLGASAERPEERFFYLRPGVTWLMVGDDLGRANLFLRPVGEGVVEVFTGANFPQCLSRPEFFGVDTQAPYRLAYDNRQFIRFSLELVAEQEATKAVVSFPAGYFFAVTVLRCPECGS